MTKNEAELTISIIDENGNLIGKTYPKRAKGLIKKCRAQYVSDNEIRLITTDPTCENTEDSKMDNLNNTEVTTEAIKKNYIFFNPKKWQVHPDVPDSVADRFYVNGIFDDSFAEIYSLGSWKWEWSEITGGMMKLEKNTEYHFVFWLNGGENDNSDETCQLHIMFTDNSLTVDKSDWESKLAYKLNRSYIRPLKKYKGWELYDIPFMTNEKEFTQIRFVAHRAPMAVMTAEEPEKYSDLENIVDEFVERRPQRHNIVFEDGWPTNTWYATSRLKSGENNVSDNRNGAVCNNFYSIEGVDTDELVQGIADSFAASYADSFNSSHPAGQVVDRAYLDELKEEFIRSLKESFGG